MTHFPANQTGACSQAGSSSPPAQPVHSGPSPLLSQVVGGSQGGAFPPSSLLGGACSGRGKAGAGPQHPTPTPFPHLSIDSVTTLVSCLPPPVTPSEVLLEGFEPLGKGGRGLNPSSHCMSGLWALQADKGEPVVLEICCCLYACLPASVPLQAARSFLHFASQAPAPC